MPIHITEDGKLIYYAYPNGDRVPDFSFCGYRRSEYPIPYIEAKVYVNPTEGDATQLIQDAIDYVSSLPLQANNFRGAVQLLPGTYKNHPPCSTTILCRFTLLGKYQTKKIPQAAFYLRNLFPICGNKYMFTNYSSV